MPNSDSIELRVERLLAAELAIQQVRVDETARKIGIGFCREPSKELFARIERAVRREFDGNWQIIAHSDDSLAQFHRHKINDHIAEFHRAHPSQETAADLEKYSLTEMAEPAGLRQPHKRLPRHARTCRRMRHSALAGIHPATGPIQWSRLVAVFFIIAYISGGWFATQDVWRGLKRRRIDVHFLMIFVALGAALVRAWTEGATLLFLFSLSNALEQFANHRTNKAIESLLKAAPQQALRRENGAWIEVAIDQVQPGDELLVQAGELFPVDGVIIEGETSADESALTGESLPVAKAPWRFRE